MAARRRVDMQQFVERCLNDPHLKGLLIAYISQAHAEINRRMIDSYHHRRHVHQEASVLHACEVALRLACKERHVLVPNLALASVLRFALRRPRILKGGTLAH